MDPAKRRQYDLQNAETSNENLYKRCNRNKNQRKQEYSNTQRQNHKKSEPSNGKRNEQNSSFKQDHNSKNHQSNHQKTKNKKSNPYSNQNNFNNTRKDYREEKSGFSWNTGSADDYEDFVYRNYQSYQQQQQNQYARRRHEEYTGMMIFIFLVVFFVQVEMWNVNLFIILLNPFFPDLHEQMYFQMDSNIRQVQIHTLPAMSLFTINLIIPMLRKRSILLLSFSL